jgi:PAS domain S-box-containing protein
MAPPITTPSVAADQIADPARLRALAQLRLDAVAEPSFERLARLGAQLLASPVCLVSLVDDTRQYFPGAVGLPSPWAELRATPLTHSFCKLVVSKGLLLRVDDALSDPRLAGNLAINDLGVRAYLGEPLHDLDGNCLGALCAIDVRARVWSRGDIEVLRDLAACVEAELALRATLRHTDELRRELAHRSVQLQDFVDSASICMRRVAPDRTILWANEAELATLGYAYHDYVGHKVDEFILDRATVEEATVRLTRGETLRDFLVRMRHRDGSVRFLRVSSSVGREPSGENVARSFSRDVTLEIAAEAARQANEDKFRRVADLAPVMLYLAAPDQRCEFVNAQWCQFAGMTREQAIGCAWPMAVHDDDVATRQTMVAQAQQAQTAYAVEVRCRRHDGVWRWLLDCAHPRLAPDGTLEGWVGACTDITEQRQAQDGRLRAERKLLEVRKVESLAQLAGGVAHDFNNLLTAILGFAEMAQQALPTAHRAHELVGLVLVAARQAGELCWRMLAYSGRGHFVLRPVRWQTVLEDHASALRQCAGDGLTLQVTVDPDVPAVLADAAQLAHALFALAANATEACSEHGRVSIAVTARECSAGDLAPFAVTSDLAPGRYVQLEVCDDGCGMTQQTLRRLFEPFFSTKAAGRGLGLAAVLGIVRGHEGGIAVDSVVGVGTRVRVLLPARPAPAMPRADEHVPAPQRSPLPAATILIVDDEALVAEVTKRRLQAAGYATVEAADGEAALALFAAAPQRFAAVVLDHTMPGIQGPEVLRELRRQRADLPVVLVSGYDRETANIAAPDARTRFLAKPCSAEQLHGAVHAVLTAQAERCDVG